MDKTNETKQDSSQVNEDSSGGGKGTTSDTEARTYSEDELGKAVNDALAKAGRDAKTLADKEADLNARQEAINAKQAEIDEQERQRDAAELEAARSDPNLMKVYQDKQSQKRESASIGAQKADIKKQRDALDRDKAEHESEIKAARETQMEIEIWKIAEAEGVDPAQLKDTMKDLDLTTVEQAKSVAKRLNKQPQDKTRHDSLLTSGKSQDWHELSPDEKIRHAVSQK